MLYSICEDYISRRQEEERVIEENRISNKDRTIGILSYIIYGLATPIRIMESYPYFNDMSTPPSEIRNLEYFVNMAHSKRISKNQNKKIMGVKAKLQNTIA